MKSLILGLALFAVAPAFAKSTKAPKKDCTPYVAQIGEVLGDYVSPCGPNYPIAHRACNEGEYAYSTEVGFSGEYTSVTLVCKNGVFAAAGAVAHRTCRKGEVAYSNEYNSTSGFYEQITVVCKNGRFVRR